MCKPQGKEGILLPSDNLSLILRYTTRGSVRYMTKTGCSAAAHLMHCSVGLTQDTSRYQSVYDSIFP